MLRVWCIWMMMVIAVSGAFSQNYEESLEKYLQLSKDGHESADLNYNIGVCYLHLNRTAKARLYLEKALVLKPYSRRIHHAIVQVKSNIEPQVEALPVFWGIYALEKIRDLANSTGWAFLTICIAMCLGAAGTILTFKGKLKESKKWLLTLSIGLFICTAFLMARRLYENLPIAILQEKTSLKIAPDEGSQEVLPLGPGTKTIVTDSLQNWYKVLLENNDLGWLPKSTIQRI